MAPTHDYYSLPMNEITGTGYSLTPTKYYPSSETNDFFVDKMREYVDRSLYTNWEPAVSAGVVSINEARLLSTTVSDGIRKHVEEYHRLPRTQIVGLDVPQIWHSRDFFYLMLVPALIALFVVLLVISGAPLW